MSSQQSQLYFQASRDFQNTDLYIKMVGMASRGDNPILLDPEDFTKYKNLVCMIPGNAHGEFIAFRGVPVQQNETHL